MTDTDTPPVLPDEPKSPGKGLIKAGIIVASVGGGLLALGYALKALKG